MNLICPKCLNEESIHLDVNDGDTLTCQGCGEEFTVRDVEAIVESWGKILGWLRAHPARTEQHTSEEAAPAAACTGAT